MTQQSSNMNIYKINYTTASSRSSFPKSFSASPSRANLINPWYLDYSHLTFWFFFFGTFIIIAWLGLAFNVATRNVEARLPVRETRGLSRAQTGDVVTSVLPMTWSITMVMHANTHSINFDENTSGTTFTLTIIAYQWGWNYFFPKDIVAVLTSGYHLAGHNKRVEFSESFYSELLNTARIDCSLEHLRLVSNSYKKPTNITFQTNDFFSLINAKIKTQYITKQQIKLIKQNFKSFLQIKPNVQKFSQQVLMATNYADVTFKPFIKVQPLVDIEQQLLNSKYAFEITTTRLTNFENLLSLQPSHLLKIPNNITSKNLSTLIDLPYFWTPLVEKKMLTSFITARTENFVKSSDNINSMRRLQVTKGVLLPSDIPIHLICGSKDVIHSWAIPGLGIKIDCIPGFNSHRRLNLRWRGVYWGQCMEVCGRYHHWMPILVRVVHKDIFLSWCLVYVRSHTLNTIPNYINISLYKSILFLCAHKLF